MNLVLNPRLQGVEKFVTGGKIFADVGTDHAYLPTYLLLNGIIPYAYASDIRKGPLESARRTVESYGVADKTGLILCDGLDLVPDDAEEIAIAGMGGIMIADIVARTTWLRNKQKHLILQPMTKISYLRKQLYKNGFEIEKEEVICDGPKVYVVMSVYYSGKTVEIDELFSYIGKTLNASGDKRRYLIKQVKKLDRIAYGLIESGEEENKEKANELLKLRNQIGDILEGKDAGKRDL